MVYRKSKEENDIELKKVLVPPEQAGITLNKDRSEFEVAEAKCMGHIINYKMIGADSEKARAIRDFPVFSNRKKLRFFKIVNYLRKFTPLLADKNHQLRQLLRGECEWVW